MLEGPRPCIIFCFAFLHYAWITWPKRFYWVFPRPVVSSYCVLLTVKATKENKNIQQRISSFITCPPIKCSRDFVYLLLKRYISKWQLAVASTGLVEVQKIKACSRTYAALIIREDCLKLSFNLFCIHLILSSTSGQPIILLELYFSPKRQVRMIHESFCVFWPRFIAGWYLV